MDIVFIRDLKVETVIGVYDWERRIRQIINIDLEMGTDVRPAAQTDTIDQALDYQAVAERLVEFVGGSRFQLIETLAEQIGEIVCREFGVSWLRLTVRKPGALSNAREVGVIIERGQRG